MSSGVWSRRRGSPIGAARYEPSTRSADRLTVGGRVTQRPHKRHTLHIAGLVRPLQVVGRAGYRSRVRVVRDAHVYCFAVLHNDLRRRDIVGKETRNPHDVRPPIPTVVVVARPSRTASALWQPKPVASPSVTSKHAASEPDTGMTQTDTESSARARRGVSSNEGSVPRSTEVCFRSRVTSASGASVGVRSRRRTRSSDALVVPSAWVVTACSSLLGSSDRLRTTSVVAAPSRTTAKTYGRNVRADISSSRETPRLAACDDCCRHCPRQRLCSLRPYPSRTT